MKYLTCMIRRTQCMMWPHLLLLLILMMVMMVLHHAISSWFHTIRCMTILFFIPRALSHTYLRLNIRSNAWKRKDGNESVMRETCVPATLPWNPQEGNLKFQPPHTGNQRPVIRASQSERWVEILGVFCFCKGRGPPARFCRWEEWTRITSVCFTCLSLHNSNTWMMLEVANEIRLTIKCEQSYIICLGSANKRRRKQHAKIKTYLR